MPLSLKLPRRNPAAPRPSLRERYAALKGSAAKVIGKPARFTPPQPIGAGKPSKALAALIDAHQLAYAAYLIARSDWTPDLDARRQAEEEAFRALLHSPLCSDADRAAYAIAVIERQAGALGDHVATGRDHPLSVAYRSLRFGEHAREPEAMRHVGRPAEPAPAADPILAAIDAHRAAYTAWHPLMLAWGDTLAGTPEYEAAETIDAAARQCERDAFRALLTIQPTTSAGFVALAAYLPDAMRQSNPDMEAEALAALDALRSGALSLRREAATPMAPAEAQPAPDINDRARFSAEQIDLTALDLIQLSSLFEACQVAKFMWEGVAARPYSFEETGSAPLTTALGEAARFEEERASWLMDLIEREAITRTPEDIQERDEILMVRTQQEFRSNARIHDNALLLDITRAWIV